MFSPAWPGQLCSLGWDLIPQVEDDLGVELTTEQRVRLVQLYELDPMTGRRKVRRAALRRPKGAGKSPEGGFVAYCELVLPVRFEGWSRAGRPIGAPLTPANGPATGPWVQLAAVSEDQTDNVMVWLFETLAEAEGTRRRRGIDLGRSRIYLHGQPGRIEPVTAAAGSREGQPITFAVLDQTESWFKANGGRRLADVCRRNAGKTGGWTYELQNAPEPGDGSVADETRVAAEKRSSGVLFDTREAPVVDRDDRVALLDALSVAYGESSAWVDLERIADEIQDPATDWADARRYYLNQQVLADTRAFDAERWSGGLVRPGLVAPAGDTITLGFDGSRFHDSTAIIGTHLATGLQWVVGLWDPDGETEVPDDEVDGVMVEAFDRWRVWVAYCDPYWWEDMVDRWAGRWGARRVKRWWTNRPRQMAFALRAYATAMDTGEVVNDGDERLAAHIAAARKRDTNVRDDEGRRMWVIQKEHPKSPLKIDAAMAGCLSWEARGDAVASGALKRRRGGGGFSM